MVWQGELRIRAASLSWRRGRGGIPKGRSGTHAPRVPTYDHHPPPRQRAGRAGDRTAAV